MERTCRVCKGALLDSENRVTHQWLGELMRNHTLVATLPQDGLHFERS